MRRNITCEQTGQTFAQCDCCKRYNILPTDLTMTVVVFGAKKAIGTAYLLCPECSRKFKKVMEDFIDAEGSTV